MFRNSIKMLLPLSFLLLPLTVSASNCSGKIGCERKACEIERKMVIAKENGHHGMFDGLSDALARVNDYCTNNDLKEELLAEIDESQSEIIDYRSELNEATTDKEEDKILKYQRKIEEEKINIKKLEEELSLLQ
ncbi:DUF1090 domain-containing protein [Photobacterium sanguinicancri]|uniref:DUF1090 domain-containing protein n=1 Tax=Photobacterium sanguinicancri TaxID=875932 RepID=UPI0026E12D41|nr:DUF1090 domain-containing protein [Photobacterium sanguinicancri]MDO6496769.1 DUF1090 domain-containing protein [Photobacterium sanguinicancri]